LVTGQSTLPHVKLLQKKKSFSFYIQHLQKVDEAAPRMEEPSQTMEDPTMEQKNLLQAQNNPSLR
jgi:hypothetical protein